MKNAEPDPRKGGIQFYITEYTEEVAAKYHPTKVEELTGAITIVMRAAKVENELVAASLADDSSGYENNGF